MYICELIVKSTRDRAQSVALPTPKSGTCGTTAGSLGATIQSFKKTTTRKIRQLLQDPEIRIWQRDYHDHIIRNHADLVRIREYTTQNPARWQSRHESP